MTDAQLAQHDKAMAKRVQLEEFVARKPEYLDPVFVAALAAVMPPDLLQQQRQPAKENAS